MAYQLRFSKEPVVTLPFELARLAGLHEGSVQVLLGDQSLTVAPLSLSADYADRWQAIAMSLRQQASSYGVEPGDRRDDEYWAIVNSAMEETEHWVGLV